MKKIIYAAYGSNMYLPQMASRCPEAEPIGTGKIKGYRLSFRKSSSGFYASIDREEGSEVPVVLWLISAADEQKLDCYEGCPKCYLKTEVTVDVSRSGLWVGRPRRIQAMTYKLPEFRPKGMPRPEYINLLCEGYHRFGFSAEYLKKALTIRQSAKMKG